jgi:hypothetical protein
MRKVIACLTLCSFGFLGNVALAQINVLSDSTTINNLTEVTTPTQVGMTTIPSGTYVMTDESSGKTYPLIITRKGTMVLGPAGSGTQDLASLRTQNPTMKQSLEKDLGGVIEKEGISGLKNFIK